MSLTPVSHNRSWALHMLITPFDRLCSVRIRDVKQLDTCLGEEVEAAENSIAIQQLRQEVSWQLLSREERVIHSYSWSMR
jgi:hypothetical protein